MIFFMGCFLSRYLVVFVLTDRCSIFYSPLERNENQSIAPTPHVCLVCIALFTRHPRLRPRRERPRPHPPTPCRACIESKRAAIGRIKRRVLHTPPFGRIIQRRQPRLVQRVHEGLPRLSVCHLLGLARAVLLLVVRAGCLVLQPLIGIGVPCA